MKSSHYFFPLLILLAIIWFVITWMYISLDIYDMSEIPNGGYKVLQFREKFIELALIFGMFAFGFCLGSYFFGDEAISKTEDRYGFVPKINKNDNLQIIEGIGPKIEKLLQNAGMTTFKKLKETSADEIKKVLERGGKQFGLANPSTWSKQAELAYNKHWKELEEYQEKLIND